MGRAERRLLRLGTEAGQQRGDILGQSPSVVWEMLSGVHLDLYQVDAFAPAPFRGNPAAVCLLPYTIKDGVRAADLPDTLLLAIAEEMNLSETAFPEVRSPPRQVCVLLTTCAVPYGQLLRCRRCRTMWTRSSATMCVTLPCLFF